MTPKENPIPDLVKPKYSNAFLLSLIVGIIGFLLYINTLGHVYVLDDDAIIDNLYVKQGISGIPKLFTVDFWFFENVKLGYYRPLSLATAAVEYQFFGDNPHVGHFDNALLYGITGFMLCLLLGQLFAGKNPAFAFLISLVFIAHPIHTEVIANIKSRDEILSFLNTIVMLYFALRFASTKKRSDLVWSLIFFYLALISKETAVVGIILLPVFLFYSGNKIPVIFRKILPYAAVAVFFFLQKRYFLGSDAVVIYDDKINYPYTSPNVKIPTVFHIFLFCLSKLVFPWPLTYDYSYNQVPASHWGNGNALLGVVLFIGLSIAAIIGFFRKTIWGLGLTFLFITIIPSLAFVYLRGGIMAERFLYAPSLGFSILIIYFLSLAFNKPGKEPKINLQVWIKNNSVLAGIVALIFFVYSIETVARNGAWKDRLTLFSTDIGHSSGSCLAHHNLGIALLSEAQNEKDSIKRKQYFDSAVSQFHKAISIFPNFTQAYFEIGFGYHSVEKNLDSAAKYYKKSSDIPPGFAKAYNNLGVLYQNAQRGQLASYYYNKAVELDPKNEEALGHATKFKKESGLDVHEFPGEDTTSLNKPIITNVSPAEVEEKVKKFNTYFTLGAEAVKRNDFASGINNFKKAEALIPDNEKNLIYLANSYGMAKQYPEAVKTFQLILKKYPDDQAVIKNLAITYNLMGEKEKGEETRKMLK